MNEHLTVGRAPSAGLSLPEVERLSRIHFTIASDGRRHCLRHLSQSNLTRLNDVPCESGLDYPLLDGDAIVAGGLLFTFLLGTPCAE